GRMMRETIRENVSQVRTSRILEQSSLPFFCLGQSDARGRIVPRCVGHFIGVICRFAKSPSLLLPTHSPISPPSSVPSLPTSNAGAAAVPAYTWIVPPLTTTRSVTQSVGETDASTSPSNLSGQAFLRRGQS